ncbi:DUF6707 family protein [Lachnoanaerobaculum gingivalis]|uniref:DUF6707 family protein n=1 Tax=Lachnoanaerobaculum gingivalis TaxID=2490855 RepID=UPI0024A6AA2C|nr:DUF6707 family protein [Lachnoanaerobaculum gingivalis]WHE88557.1 hypothetical protein QJR73_06030 [Lachnoanaerobaculum gingivalis]
MKKIMIGIMKMNFDELSLKYKEKNIVKLSKKLAKSFALTRSKDMTNLHDLAFWLYIYDYKDEILNIYNLVNIDIPEKIDFNIWTWILSIWGLQAYIYESEGEISKKDEIVANMKKVYSVPRTKEDTEESTWKFYTRIAGRQTLESVSYVDKIESAIQSGNKSSETAYRFSGLSNMISYGVTGFYPHLVENRDKLEEKIKEYIQYLRS